MSGMARFAFQPIRMNFCQHWSVIKRIRNCVAILCFLLVDNTSRALNPSLPPGGNFDLNHWYLQLPTLNGVLTGTAAGNVDSASTPQLVAGFTNAYFYTATDGAMTFWTPDNGATTSGSAHPRSELRELLNTNDTTVNWTLYGQHTLIAQCKVLQVPADTGKVCIGQIHEPGTRLDGSTSANNEQMIMFDLPNQKIYANINLDGDLASSFGKTFISGASVATNTVINYSMSVLNGVLTISVNNVTNAWNLFSGTNFQGHIAQNWDKNSGNTVYLKAGDYNQTTNQCNCSTDGARVAFYALTTFHAPSITSQPASVTNLAGSNAAFNVGALGNAGLNYQWFFNATNKLSAATNALLTMANVGNTNAGNYAVVVSDNYGSVTSAVATLTVRLTPFVTGSIVTNQNFRFTFTGAPSSGFWIQSNTNLASTGWTTIATNASDGLGFSSFTDTNYVRYPTRFYRVVMP